MPRLNIKAGWLKYTTQHNIKEGEIVNIRYCDISKVLPLVYDDSLSYYEVLCKVKEKMNEIIDLDNLQSEAINELGDQSAERYNKFEQKILADLAEMKVELEEDIASGDNDVMEQLSALISTLSDEVDGLDESVADATASVNALSGEVSTLSDAVDAFGTRLGTCESNVTDLNNAIDAVEDDVDNLKSRMSTAEGNISTNANDIDLLEDRVTGVEESISGLVFADVDDELSTTSTNPVENQVITNKINEVEGDIPSELSDLSDVDFNNPTVGQLLGFDSNGNVVNVNEHITNVVDALNSSSATDALSAKQGKVLNETKANKTDLYNENLLDNPFFTVNERGQSSYSVAGYTVDRYRTWSNDVTVTPLSPNGVTIANGGSANYVLTQYITAEKANFLRGKKVTLSLMLTDGTIIKATDTIADSGTVTLVAEETDIKIRLHIGSSQHWVDIYVDGTKNVDRIKLELGSTCTIALDTPNAPSIELAKCQTSTADANDTYANKGNLVTSNSIAPTEDGATASKAYAVGEHFFRGGEYCICISPIASGGSFTLNTNYKVTSVGNDETIVSAVTDIPSGLLYVTNELTKNGKVVEINLNMINNDSQVTFTNGSILGKLPVGFRPHLVTYATLFNRDHTKALAIYISVAGNITCYESVQMPQGDFFYGTITLVVA